MKINEIVQVIFYFGLLIGLAPILGTFMARVFKGERTFLHPLLQPVENGIYRVTGIDPREEMTWLRYFWAVFLFNLVGLASLWALQVTQALLPLNPQKFGNVEWALALNTAVSFITNTNWQAYMGESTMSYFTQMAGLAVHNFLSAASGIAVLLAIARGLQRASSKTIGSFWVDLNRATLYVLVAAGDYLVLGFGKPGRCTKFFSLQNGAIGRALHHAGAQNRRQRPACEWS
jgi:K+-transporting ATPase ATPase A chain